MKPFDMKYQSDKRFDMLKKRTERCVCKYCGGKLYLRQIIFSSYEEVRVEIFCKNCNRIEFGVEPEIYKSANYFVDETEFNCFPDLDDSEKTRQMSIAKLCEIMTWQNQNIGILTPDGYQIATNMKDHFIGECVTFSDADLELENDV